MYVCMYICKYVTVCNVFMYVCMYMCVCLSVSRSVGRLVGRSAWWSVRRRLPVCLLSSWVKRYMHIHVHFACTYCRYMCLHVSTCPNNDNTSMYTFVSMQM